jgi:hypothetical protein
VTSPSRCRFRQSIDKLRAPAEQHYCLTAFLLHATSYDALLDDWQLLRLLPFLHVVRSHLSLIHIPFLPSAWRLYRLSAPRRSAGPLRPPNRLRRRKSKSRGQTVSPPSRSTRRRFCSTRHPERPQNQSQKIKSKLRQRGILRRMRTMSRGSAGSASTTRRRMMRQLRSGGRRALARWSRTRSVCWTG